MVAMRCMASLGAAVLSSSAWAQTGYSATGSSVATPSPQIAAPSFAAPTIGVVNGKYLKDVKAQIREKERKYPSTMNVPRYWSDVPAATRHVFKSFTKVLTDGQKGVGI